MSLQRQRDSLQDIIEQMKANSNPAVDRESFIGFAEQVLGTIDAMLAAIDDTASRISQG